MKAAFRVSMSTLIFLTPCMLVGAEPTVKELGDGIHRRIHEFRNVQFEYTVDAVFWPAPEMQVDSSGNPTAMKASSDPPRNVKSKDVFRILDPILADSDRPWRSWQRMIEEDGSWVIDELLTYNGQQMRLYLRRAPDSDKDFNSGTIAPFESTFYYDDNIFDRFLCTDLNGLAEYMDPGWKLSRDIDNNWKIDGKRDYNGHTAYVLRGHNPYADHLLHVIGFPHFLVVRRVTTQKGNANAELLAQWDVTSIAEFNGTLYPASGTFTQSPEYSQPQIEYAFRVTVVESVDELARTDWQPEWPPGTVVRDQVSNTNQTVPHAEGQLEKITRRRTGTADRQLGPVVKSRRPWVLIINIVGIIILLAWLALRRIRIGRDSSRVNR